MSEGPRELALRLFSGQLDEAWKARAWRIHDLMVPVLGADGPAADAIPDRRQKRGPRLTKMHTPERDRGPAERAVEAFLSRLLMRDVAALAPIAAPRLWVLWPSGEILRHERDPLFAALEKRGGAPSRAVPRKLRAYGDAELRSLVARGIPESIAAMFDLSNAIAVTAELASGSGPPCRVLAVTAKDQAGVWRVHNLPLPGIDDAHRASVAPSADEDEALRVADRLVRHFWLGHDKHVRALRNQLMDQVWIDGAIGEAERMFALAAEGPHRLERADTVFLRTKKGEPSQLQAMPSIRRIAAEAWGRPLERLTTRVAVTELAMFDPRSLELGDRREAVSLLVAAREGEGRPQRWRLAAMVLA